MSRILVLGAAIGTGTSGSARRPQLRLRIVTGARPEDAARIRLPCRHRAVVWRHLLQQLLPQRHHSRRAADRGRAQHRRRGRSIGGRGASDGRSGITNGDFAPRRPLQIRGTRDPATDAAAGCRRDRTDACAERRDRSLPGTRSRASRLGLLSPPDFAGSTHADLVSTRHPGGSADAGCVNPACVGGFGNRTVPRVAVCGTAIPPRILVTRARGWSPVCRSPTGAARHPVLSAPPARTHAVVAHRPDSLRDLAGARCRAG